MVKTCIGGTLFENSNTKKKQGENWETCMKMGRFPTLFEKDTVKDISPGIYPSNSDVW